ncbi:hypothetical protein GCM10023091_07270 [Ravibacter arvi]|uniref:Ricin B lectin domain-containing protein n=1 Tax=Ravibacter arvi TaxID=2051041 RepID=A0ABP8LPE4_9BACT
MKTKLSTSLIVIAAVFVPAYVVGQNCSPRSSLPTLCITTTAPVTSKDDYVAGSMQIVEEKNGPVELYNGGIRIRGRGNSTWLLDKKPYRINLNTAASLLGMPSVAKNWVLLANHAEKTLVRNSLALELSRYMGLPYSSPFRYVDVILNGDFIGSYLLTDHMEVRSGRVDIEEGQPASVPGAYLVELDGFAWQEPYFIRTTQGLIATVKYPDLVKPQDDAKIEAITNDINDFEQRLFSDIHPEAPGGYLERIDKSSLINWYIACEITGNSDAFWSVYLHKRRSDNHIFLGPLWDFDIAFDNDDRIASARYRLMADVGQDYIFRRWIVRLRNDDVFMSAVKLRWNELKNNGLKDHLLGKINEYTSLLTSSGSQQQNYTRWPVLSTKVYKEVFWNGSYEDHVNFLSDYVEQRIDWLDTEINGLSQNYRYQIVNRQNGKALAAPASGTGVVQKTLSENNDFLWEVKPLPNGFFQLYNVGRQLVLAGTGSAGAQAVLSGANPADPLQQWRITKTSDDSYAFVNRKASMGLQNSAGSISDGAPVHTIDFNAFIPQNGISEVQHWLAGSQAGKWTITSAGSALPILIREFKATNQENAVRLDWKVTEQVNGSHFGIERLNKDLEAVQLATVSLGDSQDGTYHWVDEQPVAGIQYYRVKMVDLDGSFEYTNLVSVTRHGKAENLKVFPNPSSRFPEVHFFSSGTERTYLEVYNLTGVRMFDQVVTATRGWNIASYAEVKLPAGLYVLKVTDGNTSSSRQFVMSP